MIRTCPLVIGHRGNAGPAPANTLVGYEQAIAMGADMIEVDLRTTRDGAIVLIHDDTLDETTDGSGPVEALTLRELKQLDAGSWKAPQYRGERIPTLEEALDLAKGRIALSLDLKDTRAIPHMVRAVREAGMLDQVVVCGCDVPRAKQVRDAEPRFTVVLNMDAAMEELAKQDASQFAAAYIDQAAGSHLAALNVNHRFLSEELVYRAHLRALPVWTWTVDEPGDIQRALRMGVDAIYSNWPARVLSLL